MAVTKNRIFVIVDIRAYVCDIEVEPCVVNDVKVTLDDFNDMLMVDESCRMAWLRQDVDKELLGWNLMDKVKPVYDFAMNYCDGDLDSRLAIKLRGMYEEKSFCIED